MYAEIVKAENGYVVLEGSNEGYRGLHLERRKWVASSPEALGELITRLALQVRAEHDTELVANV